MLVILIKIFPIIGACLAFIFFDFARSLRHKGVTAWLFPAFLSLCFIGVMVAWYMNDGYHNAETWSKEWSK